MKLTILFIQLGILSVTCNISFICRSEFLFDIKTNFFQIKGFQRLSGTFSQHLSTSTKNLSSAISQRNYLCAKRFWEASIWLAHKAFEEVQYWPREIKLFSSFNDLRLAVVPSGFYSIIIKFVRDKELCQISNDFGGWSNFDNVSQKPMCLNICLFGFLQLALSFKIIPSHWVPSPSWVAWNLRLVSWPPGISWT